MHKTEEQTVTDTIYLHARILKYGDRNIEYSMSPFDMTEHGYLVLGKEKFSMEVPGGIDLTGKTVDILKKEQEKIQAEAGLKIKNIEEQIQNMLALPSPKVD